MHVIYRLRAIFGRVASAVRSVPFLFGLDQVLSSASNAVLSVVALVIASTRDFGLFALGMAVLGISVGFVRSAVLEWELLDGTAGPDVQKLLVRSLKTTSLISMPAMTVISLAGLMPAHIALLFVAATLFSSGCDVFRFAALANGEPIDACVVDASWLGLMIGGTLAAWAFGAMSIPLLLGIYAVMGGVAMLVGYARTPPQQTAANLGLKRPLRSAMFGADFALNVASGHAVTFLLPAFFGLGMLGSYRAILTLFQPFTTVAYSLRLWQLKYLDWGASRRRTAIGASAGQLVLGLMYLAPLLTAYSYGAFDSIAALQEASIVILVLAAVSETLRTVSQVGFDVARALNRIGAVVVSRSIQIIVLALGTLVLTHYFDIAGAIGSRGAAYGCSMVAVLVGLLWGKKSNGRRKHGPYPPSGVSVNGGNE